jgi:antitoxin (DNA-binding transcriptional repressor) of toxin-antitoxin stability system
VDEIRLTLPREPRFYPVAHLVLGGIGSRLELTVDGLDDLRLALDNLLERARSGGEVTIAVRLDGGTLITKIGPFDGELRGEFGDERASELGLGRILDALTDGVTVRDQDDGVWVTLEKRVAG